MHRTPGFLKRTMNALCSHRRRARAAGSQHDYGAEELRHLVLDSAHTGCRYCRCTLTEENFSCDHSQPTSRGGRHELANLEITCKSCNEAKGALTAEEFSTLWQALWALSSES